MVSYRATGSGQLQAVVPGPGFPKGGARSWVIFKISLFLH